jgi:hypothetical protein
MRNGVRETQLVPKFFNNTLPNHPLDLSLEKSATPINNAPLKLGEIIITGIKPEGDTKNQI